MSNPKVTKEVRKPVPLPPVAVVSDSDRGPATADGQPWKGV